jgi:hypothetical protein
VCLTCHGIGADFEGATEASAPAQFLQRGLSSSHITRKKRLRLGLCHRPHWGAHSAPPDPLAVLEEVASRQGMGGVGHGSGMGGTFGTRTLESRSAHMYYGVHDVCR